MFDDMNFISEQLLCHWSQMGVPGWCDEIINLRKKRPKSDAQGPGHLLFFFGGMDNS